MLGKRLTAVSIILCFCCFTALGDEELIDDRTAKEYMPEVWHAIQTIPEGATGWIPRDPANNLDLQVQGGALTKRRRLRKRKRRPPIVTYLDQSAESLADQEPPHPTLVRNISKSEDPWEEMQEESGRPYVRRKVTPAYTANYSPMGASISFGTEPKGTESPFTPAAIATRKTANIKEILKQSGGLSLSEILQQKNVTLSELLMGKKEAIQALTERMPSPALDLVKYKRVPPSIGLRKEGISRRYESFTESQEILSSRERMEAQRKRLALLQGHNYLNFAEVTRFDVVTEPTTDKRIFVPPSTPVPIPATSGYAETSTATERQLETTTKAAKSGFTRSKTGLPLTSAILMKMATKKGAAPSKPLPEEEENYPKVNGMLLKPIKISVKDILKPSENQPEEKIPDEPLRMSIDLESILDPKPTPAEFSPSPPVPTPTTGQPKLKPYSAREEILQVLKDPVGRAGLARILEARNMSVQELIEQRERGSSQLHLADIFHNNTREPEPAEDAFEGKISSEVFSSLPVFARQPKGLLSEAPKQATEASPVASLPSFKIEVNSTGAAFHWQHLFNGQNQSNDQEKLLLVPVANAGPPKIEEVDILTEEDIQRLVDVDQHLYSSLSNERLNIDETPPQLLNISSGVKSAIAASLVIVLLSIVVFVAILVVFRWRQNRKKRSNYGGSLKPALISIKRRNIKTFVAETLGKTNVNYYKRHLQSMSDDSWETESKSRNEF